MVGANGHYAKGGTTATAGVKVVAIPRLPNGPVPVKKNVTHEVLVRADGGGTKKEKVVAAFSNGSLFAHKSIGGKGYAISDAHSGMSVRPSYLSKKQAEHIIRSTATQRSARRLKAMSDDSTSAVVKWHERSAASKQAFHTSMALRRYVGQKRFW